MFSLEDVNENMARDFIKIFFYHGDSIKLDRMKQHGDFFGLKFEMKILFVCHWRKI